MKLTLLLLTTLTTLARAAPSVSPPEAESPPTAIEPRGWASQWKSKKKGGALDPALAKMNSVTIPPLYSSENTNLQDNNCGSNGASFCCENAGGTGGNQCTQMSSADCSHTVICCNVAEGGFQFCLGQLTGDINVNMPITLNVDTDNYINNYV